jgi:ABC-2 type transport system ATP-binding protein
MDAIDARGLTRDFGERRAVDGVTLRLGRGETLALLGPNGAGKSTTVNMLTTMLPLTSGTATVAGHDVRSAPQRVRASIGVVFQGPSLELQLTARQNLRFHAMLYGVPRATWAPRAERLLALTELAARADEKVFNFSGGMRRRLEIARALLHGPSVVFLDEPTIGLDPQARRHTWDFLQKLQEDTGMGVLLTTHDMQEADVLAERVAIIDHGKLVAVDTPDALKGQMGEGMVVLRFDGPAEKVAARLRAVAGVREVQVDGKTARVRVARPERALPAMLEAAAGDGIALEEMDVRKPTLEDVFIARTGHQLRDAR